MPRPYLSILSPSSFRRHFSSSSPVAHPGVTRFSVAGGRRQKASGGSRLSQEVTGDTQCGTQMFCTVCLTVTSHFVFEMDEHFWGIPVHHPGDPAQTSDRCRESSRAAFHKWKPYLSVSHAPRPHTQHLQEVATKPCGFKLMTSYPRVISWNSAWPFLSEWGVCTSVCLRVFVQQIPLQNMQNFLICRMPTRLKSNLTLNLINILSLHWCFISSGHGRGDISLKYKEWMNIFSGCGIRWVLLKRIRLWRLSNR